ncbi:MAG: nitroreductase family protein [Pseudomonadota bacterium]
MTDDGPDRTEEAALRDALAQRYGEATGDWSGVAATLAASATAAGAADAVHGAPDTTAQRQSALTRLAGHRSSRAFAQTPPPLDLVRAIAAIAFSAPSKSDLQQRDLVIVENADTLKRLKGLLAHQPWTAAAPRLMVVCGNNRRQRQLHDLRGHPFVNDHLDALFNAAVDAGILIQAFITAAETVGLACCPISGIRDHADAVSDVLALPDYVFPVAGLAIGWPSGEDPISMRLPLNVTVHVDRHDDANVAAAIDGYDARRASANPYANQRGVDRFGTLPNDLYGWSEDKARQYAEPERTGFGTFIKKKRFRLV